MNNTRETIARWREITNAAPNREAAVERIVLEFSNTETPEVGAHIREPLERVVRDMYFVREKRPEK